LKGENAETLKAETLKRGKAKRFRLISCRREIVFAQHALMPHLNHESRETCLAARPSAEARFRTV
jgi:hypothetical protein